MCACSRGAQAPGHARDARADDILEHSSGPSGCDDCTGQLGGHDGGAAEVDDVQRDCADCGYCAGIADRAVSIDPAFLQTMLPLYEDFEDRLTSGRF